jgi:hypothetical protein
MRARVSFVLAVAAGVASCGGGPPSPPALAYRLPSETEVTYAVTDTVTVGIEMLGQSLDIEVGSAALYGVSFARAEDGIRVTLTVEDLDARITVPMAGPMSFDEGIVSGDLVFTMDRRGDVTVLSTPDVEEAGAQLLLPIQVAHSFFPGLPGEAVAVGDTWVDTVSFTEVGDSEGSQVSILEYRLVGDTLVEGRSLRTISFSGTMEVSQTMNMQGMEAVQSSEVEMQGHVLWDAQSGLMFERDTRASGSGTVSVAPLPTPLPTRLEGRMRTRLQSR